MEKYCYKTYYYCIPFHLFIKVLIFHQYKVHCFILYSEIVGMVILFLTMMESQLIIYVQIKLTKNATTCSACPSNAASCSNGWQINLTNDTWRSSILSTNIIKCRLDGNLIGTYEQSYTGPLCQACNNLDGYVRSSSNKCGKCFYSTLVTGFMAIEIIFLGIGYMHISTNIIYESTQDIIAGVNAQ